MITHVRVKNERNYQRSFYCLPPKPFIFDSHMSFPMESIKAYITNVNQPFLFRCFNMLRTVGLNTLVASTDDIRNVALDWN